MLHTWPVTQGKECEGVHKSKYSGWDYLVEDFDSHLQILFHIQAPYIAAHCVTLIR